MNRFLFVILFLGVAGELHAQLALESEPARPLRGALIRLHVTPTLNDLVTEVRGEVEEEPLHFSSPDNGVTWSALAPVAVDGGDSLPILLVLVHSGQHDTIRTAIAVTRPAYPSEQLTVAPRMAEPDSAGRAKIARDSKRARAVSRAAHGTAQLWEGGFRLPRPSRITSDFGTGREYNGKVTSRHLGTDFDGRVGSPIIATNRGRVALVARFYLAGNVIYLDHGGGLISGYFHLSKTLVKTGQVVEKGQVIGQVGRTGRVTGPHLHWIMRYGGITLDPMSVLQLLGRDSS